MCRAHMVQIHVRHCRAGFRPQRRQPTTPTSFLVIGIRIVSRGRFVATGCTRYAVALAIEMDVANGCFLRFLRIVFVTYMARSVIVLP